MHRSNQRVRTHTASWTCPEPSLSVEWRTLGRAWLNSASAGAWWTTPCGACGFALLLLLLLLLLRWAPLRLFLTSTTACVRACHCRLAPEVLRGEEYSLKVDVYR